MGCSDEDTLAKMRMQSKQHTASSAVTCPIDPDAPYFVGGMPRAEAFDLLQNGELSLQTVRSCHPQIASLGPCLVYGPYGVGFVVPDITHSFPCLALCGL